MNRRWQSLGCRWCDARCILLGAFLGLSGFDLLASRSSWILRASMCRRHRFFIPDEVM